MIIVVMEDLRNQHIGLSIKTSLQEDVTLVFKDYDWGANAGVGPSQLTHISLEEKDTKGQC